MENGERYVRRQYSPRFGLLIFRAVDFISTGLLRPRWRLLTRIDRVQKQTGERLNLMAGMRVIAYRGRGLAFPLSVR